MEITIDLIKQVRETIDWILNKSKDIKDVTLKSKLNLIINDISTLIIHKQSYLRNIRNAADENSRRTEIKKALEIAREDTLKLRKDIEDTGLQAADLTIGLDTKLKLVTQTKEDDLIKFSYLVLGKKDIDSNEIVSTLASFESQWQEIGEKLEQVKEKLKK